MSAGRLFIALQLILSTILNKLDLWQLVAVQQLLFIRISLNLFVYKEVK